MADRWRTIGAGGDDTTLADWVTTMGATLTQNEGARFNTDAAHAGNATLAFNADGNTVEIETADGLRIDDQTNWTYGVRACQGYGARYTGRIILTTYQDITFEYIVFVGSDIGITATSADVDAVFRYCSVMQSSLTGGNAFLLIGKSSVTQDWEIYGNDFIAMLHDTPAYHEDAIDCTDAAGGIFDIYHNNFMLCKLAVNLGTDSVAKTVTFKNNQVIQCGGDLSTPVNSTPIDNYNLTEIAEVDSELTGANNTYGVDFSQIVACVHPGCDPRLVETILWPPNTIACDPMDYEDDPTLMWDDNNAVWGSDVNMVSSPTPLNGTYCVEFSGTGSLNFIKARLFLPSADQWVWYTVFFSSDFSESNKCGYFRLDDSSHWGAAFQQGDPMEIYAGFGGFGSKGEFDHNHQGDWLQVLCEIDMDSQMDVHVQPNGESWQNDISTKSNDLTAENAKEISLGWRGVSAPDAGEICWGRWLICTTADPTVGGTEDPATEDYGPATTYPCASLGFTDMEGNSGDLPGAHQPTWYSAGGAVPIEHLPRRRIQHLLVR